MSENIIQVKGFITKFIFFQRKTLQIKKNVKTDVDCIEVVLLSDQTQ